ncbi:MAG: hypothetical protein KKI08_02295, partial [Armatimonadetes bacterium]|nr:hypothetical protein [Armatimonadota bacterium]
MRLRYAVAVALLVASLATVAPVAADLPQGLTYDDGYAWFQVKTVVDTKDGKPYAKGWTLGCELRAFGEVPDHSAFKIILKKNGTAVAALRADASIYHFKQPAFNDMPSHASVWLQDRNQIISGEGPFQAEVYFIKGDDMSEHLARTHLVDIRKVTKVRGNGEPDASDYFVNRHGEAAASLIVQRPARQRPYLGDARNTTYDKNVVDVYFGTSADKTCYNLPRGGFLRSTVNGQPLDLSAVAQYAGNDAIKDQMTPMRFYQVIHTAKGNVREEVDFRQFRVVLPLTWGKADDQGRDPTKPSISDHPGNWEAQYVVNGAPIRTWRFTVGDDGNIA